MLIWLKKVKHYKKIKFLESIYENGKNNYKTWWYWNPKTNISPAQRTYFKKNDINKIAVSNNVSLVKKIDFIGYEDVKKLDTYAYLSQKECI